MFRGGEEEGRKATGEKFQSPKSEHPMAVSREGGCAVWAVATAEWTADREAVFLSVQPPDSWCSVGGPPMDVSVSLMGRQKREVAF